MIRCGLTCGLVVGLLTGCTKLDRFIEIGEPYHHVVITNISDVTIDPVHIYIEGDGRPFLNKNTVASDPTPRRTLVLNLMRSDPAGGIYIGRPCYFGMAKLSECSDRLWTGSRYSTEIIDSMAVVTKRLAKGRSIVLIGHSGGGAIALLMAKRLPKVVALVTLSGNLDLTAWARHHGYTPLIDSEDPALQLPIPPHVRQLHAVAGRDEVVPAHIIRGLANRLPSHSICSLPEFDHTCCWADGWARFIRVVDERLRSEKRSLQAACQQF
ncbi:MAG: alpha/beta hydrolase [Gammaproteobacteria bacterium]|nr:alpha/beta hydrolase [Gammaproteobacteria bacterium]